MLWTDRIILLIVAGGEGVVAERGACSRLSMERRDKHVPPHIWFKNISVYLDILIIWIYHPALVMTQLRAVLYLTLDEWKLV